MRPRANCSTFNKNKGENFLAVGGKGAGPEAEASGRGLRLSITGYQEPQRAGELAEVDWKVRARNPSHLTLKRFKKLHLVCVRVCEGGSACYRSSACTSLSKSQRKKGQILLPPKSTLSRFRSAYNVWFDFFSACTELK